MNITIRTKCQTTSVLFPNHKIHSCHNFENDNLITFKHLQTFYWILRVFLHRRRDLLCTTMARRYETMKNTSFISRKLEEILFIKAVQNFSAKMLPYFNPENYPFLNEFYSSIMASDSSPNAEYKEFSYPPAANHPGRSTPPPTTSQSARQESQAIAVDPNVTKPEKENEDLKDKDKEQKEKDKDDVDMSAPDANPGYKPEDRKDEKKKDLKEDKGGGGDSKRNGILETAFMIPLEAKDSDEEDESCTVNCLYYTMQCCECVIT